jgi:hypothetical protein
VQTAQVRLLHAACERLPWRTVGDAGRWGVPINQADFARTWLDVTLAPFTFLGGIGYRLTGAGRPASSRTACGFRAVACADEVVKAFASG